MFALASSIFKLDRGKLQARSEGLGEKELTEILTYTHTHVCFFLADREMVGWKTEEKKENVLDRKAPGPGAKENWRERENGEWIILKASKKWEARKRD